MAAFKCKMCGYNLEVTGDEKIVRCEACDTRQTISRSRDDVTRNLFNRANDLRLKCEFDRAHEIYERIVGENNDDAEAHWGVVLCKYGIEYVEDPATKKRIPTCHRAQMESVLADIDFQAVMSNADEEQKLLYQQEAKTIDTLQKDILHIAKGEKPFDVFICYKETDDETKYRTQDSVLANDIYHQLTNEGFRVFYAAITLEDKLGTAYEPYIFAALNSAKVMLAIGTKPAYFKAPWVRNEWSRYLKLIAKDRSRLLIPCYRDMDPYDLPDEFSHLQAQDMSKIGFIQDIIHGISKVIKKNAAKPKESTPTVVSGAAAPLVKRAFLYLEDGEFDQAVACCERALDTDPEYAEAYLAKLMASRGVKLRKTLGACNIPIENDPLYKKAYRFGSPELREELEHYSREIAKVIKMETERREAEERARLKAEQERLQALENAYKAATICFNKHDYEQALGLYTKLKGFRDSGKKAAECRDLLNQLRRNEEIYVRVKTDIEASIGRDSFYDFPNNTMLVEDWKNKLYGIRDYKDASDLIRRCQGMIEEIGNRVRAKRRRAKLKQVLKTFFWLFYTAGSIAVFVFWRNSDMYIFDYTTEDDGSVTITRIDEPELLINEDGVLEIPSKISEKPVKKIALDRALNGMDKEEIAASVFPSEDIPSFTSVVIPEGIVRIEGSETEKGCSLFANCTELASVKLPSSLRYIGNETFMNCDQLMTVNHPGNLLEIGERAFAGCRFLTNDSVNALLEKMTSIPKEAFKECARISGSIVIPDNIQSIGERAFAQCGGMKTIVFGTGLKNIGKLAFESVVWNGSYGHTTLPNMSYKGTISQWNSITKDKENWFTAETKVSVSCSDGHS